MAMQPEQPFKKGSYKRTIIEFEFHRSHCNTTSLADSSLCELRTNCDNVSRDNPPTLMD